jgi:hypothetical protein
MVLTTANNLELLSANCGRTTAVAHLPPLRPAEQAFLLSLLPWFREIELPRFPSDCDVNLLWEFIDRHGLGGILGASTDMIADLPPALADAAQQRYWSNCLHARQARDRVEFMVGVAQRLGVTIFCVKGPSLVDQGYGDDGLRGFSDVDLFTSSVEDARRLGTACGARVLADSAKQGIVQEIRDPGRLVLDLDGWPIEIRFPIAGWSGQFFDLFAGGHLPELEWTSRGIPAANAEWHFLFLMQHLMIHHAFGRFVWILDLAVLVWRRRASLDWDLILRKCDQLAMREALAATAIFCRRHIDPDFPKVSPPRGPAWNRPFIHHLTAPGVILSATRNKQHISAFGRLWAVLHGISGYLLLSDVSSTGTLRDGYGWQSTAVRLRCVLTSRWKSNWGSWLGNVLADLAPWFVYPLARLLAWIPNKKSTP